MIDMANFEKQDREFCSIAVRLYFLMNARKLAKLGALMNQLIFSALVQDTGVRRKKRGIEDTTVDCMKINLRSLFLFIILILFCCIVSS